MVTHAGLSRGQKATQSTHAAFKFAHEHPVITDDWYLNSTYLVLVTAKSSYHLELIADQAEQADLVVSRWFEPDMGDELTAIAIAPSLIASKLMANLPLTLREPAMS